ncbi:hypothetical protein LSG31_03900 [Fodinisporobacter ferrooxydans]|uniref:DUF8042 domain-containing protein n=1 Tax=Fodinisporobacter ferrooxydans TaxID=2901836 RepID=A0ABY4CLM3_9BACL|nr:hypothetical protein LSG31_03900 [Alicyclobacillaceae bacterium MYW30-H2]
MRVTIDGVEYKELSNTTGDLLWEEIRKTIEKQNRLIHQVLVNGDLLTENTNIPYNEVELVEVDTMSPQKLLLDTFQSAIEYLPRLIEGISQISEHFRSGAEGEGVKLYLQAEGGLNWNTQVFQNSLVFLPTQTLQSLFVRYGEILNEILMAWKNQDYISVADLLEYELIPCMQEWIEYMKQQREEHIL